MFSHNNNNITCNLLLSLFNMPGVDHFWFRTHTSGSNLVAVMDWGGANSRFLGLVSVWAARSFDQTALRPSVIKRIRQIDVKYITHITSFGVTAWTRVTAWTCMCELPRCTVHWTRISIHWILDFKQLLLLLSPEVHGCT